MAARPPVTESATGERRLTQYLLLPRPGDLVKAWIFPAAFALGVLADGTSAHQALRAAIVWLALELLIYQARYQGNDIRGFAADQRIRKPPAAAACPVRPARVVSTSGPAPSSQSFACWLSQRWQWRCRRSTSPAPS